MTTSYSGPPPGWYPDPRMAHTLRYWNGAAFTADVAPMPARSSAAPVSDGVQVIGWVCAFLFPPVGFIIGCMCISQGGPNLKHDGWWMVGVSVLFGVGGFVLFVASAMSPAYSS